MSRFVQDRDAHLTVLVDVWVPHLGQELHLWGTEREIWGERQEGSEETSFVESVGGTRRKDRKGGLVRREQGRAERERGRNVPEDCDFPLEHIVIVDESS